MDDLNQRTALVTGASRGIGRAIAFALARAGADVVINYRNRATDAQTAERQILELGRRWAEEESGSLSHALTTSSLPAGYHSIAAAYSGDANYTGSIGYVNQSVTRPTTTSLKSDKTSITYGQAVTFTATVSPSTVSGGVQFMNGTVLIGTAVLSSGQAKLSTVSLTGGTDSVTAVYSGDATDAPSTSAPQIITVAQAKPTVNLVSSQDPIAVGQTVTFTVGINAAVATRTVTFKDGSQVLGTVTLDMSTAAFSTSALSSGNHSITAVYSGDINYKQATSSPLMERVK